MDRFWCFKDSFHGSSPGCVCPPDRPGADPLGVVSGFLDPAGHPLAGAFALAERVADHRDARQVDIEVHDLAARGAADQVDQPGVEGLPVAGGVLLGPGLDRLRDAKRDPGHVGVVLDLVGARRAGRQWGEGNGRWNLVERDHEVEVASVEAYVDRATRAAPR